MERGISLLAFAMLPYRRMKIMTVAGHVNPLRRQLYRGQRGVDAARNCGALGGRCIVLQESRRQGVCRGKIRKYWGNLIPGAGFLGRKRGIFVLVADKIAENNSAMNTLAPSQPSQEINKSSRIGFLVYPSCEILDVCDPYDAFYYADTWLTRLGRTNEAGCHCVVIAAAPGPVRTRCGIELAATHSYCDIGDGLDTLVVAGGCTCVEEACKDPSLVEWVQAS
jgi:hypothetical protein